MTKSLLFRLTISLILFLLPCSLFAFYTGENAKSVNQPTPSRLIVKLKPEINISLLKGRDGVVRSGVESFDSVNRQYKIINQQFLLPNASKFDLPHSLKNMLIVDMPDDADIFEIVSEYEKLPEVEYAHPDWPLELYDSPNDPLYIEQWALNNTGQGCRSVIRGPLNGDDTLGIIYGTPDADIDYHEVYNNPPDQTITVILAVIDTGVDMDHPDLADNIWTNPGEIPGNGLDDDHNGYIDDIHGWDYCSDGSGIPPQEDNDPTDTHGHGTHCAGIAAAITDNMTGMTGINFECRIMGLKFYPIMLTSLAVRAIVYAADNGADVITMSWGMPWAVSSLEDALAYARSKGVVLCAASGNDGIERYNYPAAFPGIITVGATQWEDKVTVFSTFGSHLNISAPGQSILSLRADNTDMYDDGEPGVHIIDDMYYLASGTSMACPHVAAAAALVRSVSPGLTPDATEAVLEQAADDLIDPYGTGGNYPGWDKYSGHGRLNLNNAISLLPKLRARLSAPPPNAIVSGIVAISGIADGDGFTNYSIEYGIGSAPIAWTEIISSSTPVTDGPLGEWNTTGIDGSYTLRLSVGDDNISMVTIMVANSTTAVILDPADGDTVMSAWSITGSASSPDFSYYQLEYSPASSPGSWTEIAVSSVPVMDAELSDWDTSIMSEGWYNLRLRLFSDTGLVASDSIEVYVQSLFSSGSNWIINNVSDVTPYANYCDIDDDGAYEIILGTSSGVTFLNPDGTEKTTGVPSLPTGNYRIPAAVGDLDGDGNDDFIVCSSNKIYGFPSTQPSFEISVLATPNIGQLDAGDEHFYPYVALKDIDSDGDDEILYFTGTTSPYERYFAYESDGSLIAEMPGDHACYLAADLDGDGQDEFYMATDTVLQCDHNGVAQNSFDLKMDIADYIWSSYLSAVDIDHDGKHELIVMGHDNNLGHGDFWMYAFDENLTLKDSWPRNTTVSSFTVPPGPIFVDMDLDGSLEYFITFYELSGGIVYGWRMDGTPYSGDSINPLFVATPNPSRLYHPVFADMNGDGYPDLVASAAANVLCETTTNRLVAWDKNGDMLDGWPITVGGDNCGQTRRFVPTIGDINQDGSVDLMMTIYNNDFFFLNFDGSPYSEAATPVPFWRYNRRINSCGLLYEPLCGDVNFDGMVNIFDITYLIDYLYREGPPPPNPELADVNDDELINIFDITYLISYLYQGGPDPNCP